MQPSADLPPPPVEALMVPAAGTAPERAPTAPRQLRAWPAIAALFFLAAFIPESAVTGSTSPVRVAGEPLTLPYIIAFYGSANVLIREAWMRRNRGWASMILLGAAFGVVNEGVIAGTWYKVSYTGYTFIGGVDIPWAVGLTIFHTVFSVLVPIHLVEVLFPQRAGRPWLGRGGFIGCWLLLGLLTLGGAGIREYQGYRLGALMGAIALTVVALMLPAARQRAADPRPLPGLWGLRWSAFGLAVLHDALLFLAPPIVAGITKDIVLAQFIDIGLFLAGWAFIAAIVWRWTARANWAARQTLAIITGSLVPGILFNFTPPALELLAPLFSLPFLGFLIWATRRTGRIAAQHP